MRQPSPLDHASSTLIRAALRMRGWLRITGTTACLLLASGNAGAQALNLDFGFAQGEPSATYGAASGQAGTWNMIDLGTTALVDLAGTPTLVSVSATGTGGNGSTGGTSANEDQLLLRDNIWAQTITGWSVDFSGLASGKYTLFVYAPSNGVTPTGDMIVNGTSVSSINGDPGYALIEGVSWLKFPLTLTGSTFTISGSQNGFSGLAGLQLVPLVPDGFNIDFGSAFGAPSATYAGTGSQAGTWNQVGTQSSPLVSVAGASGITFLSSFAGFYNGSASGSHITDPELLLGDNFYQLSGNWFVDVTGLAPGAYRAYLYAPSQVGVSTSTMTVNGVIVPSLPGDPSSALIEGMSWAVVEVIVVNGTLSVDGGSSGVSGLAGMQIVPIPVGGYNLDLGAVYGTPDDSYSAASGQSGIWQPLGSGYAALTDVSGNTPGASVTVLGTNGNGVGSTVPSNNDQLLLNDSFWTQATWSVSFSDLLPGDYLVYIYAPSNTSASTGNMSVGGSLVFDFPGDPNGNLIEGTSWTKVEVTVTDGTLNLTGSGPGNSGLAGIQLVPQPEHVTYCTAGTSASGCSASISASGTPSATASTGFTLNTTSVEGAKNGLYFFGTNGRQANPWGNGTSFQCVMPPVKRAGLLSGVGTPGTCNGSFAQDLNALWCPTCPNPAKNPGAGAVVQAQLWYRDAFNTGNQSTSLSDAVEFTVQP